MHPASHHRTRSAIGPYQGADWEWAVKAAGQGEEECAPRLSDGGTRSWTR